MDTVRDTASPSQSAVMIPVRGAPGQTSIGLYGMTYEADEQGIILIPIEAYDDAASHGFRVVDDA